MWVQRCSALTQSSNKAFYGPYRQFIRPDWYLMKIEPSVEFDDQMVDEEVNESGGLHNIPVMDSVDLSNAGAFNESVAVEEWGFVTQMRKL